MIIAKLIYVAALFAFTYYLLQRFKKKSNCDDDIDFFSVADSIDELNHIKEQLASIEEMITDISCSSDAHKKFISCEWSNVIGEKFQYDLYVDGNSLVTDEMLKIAYSERKRLRTLLKQKIKNLSDRCNENCNDNYAISMTGECQDDD